MKAVILFPPVEDFYFTPHRFSALAGEVLRKILEVRGWEAEEFLFPLARKKGTPVPLPGELDYLDLYPRERGPLSWFHTFHRYGPPPGECAEQALRSRPDLVIISLFAFAYAPAALELAGEIRKRDKKVPVLMGGSGVSVYPGYFTACRDVDYVITGEGEVAFPFFLEALEKGGDFDRVPHLYRREEGRIIPPRLGGEASSGDLDFHWRITGHSGDTISLSTLLSRGCPRKCRFCVNYNRDGFSFPSLEKVSRGIESLKSFLGTGKKVRFNFEDDNLLAEKEYFFQVLRLLARAFPGIAFYAENGMDYTLLDRESTGELLDLGMKQFNLSLGTISPCLQAQESREVSLPRYEDLLAFLSSRGAGVITYFICGFKNEDKEGIIRTLHYLARQDTLLGISLFYAIPGLPGFQDLSLFASPRLCAGTAAWPWNGSLSTCELITAFRLSRYVNFTKSRTLTSGDRDLIARMRREKRLYSYLEGVKVPPAPVPGLDEDMVKKFFQGEECGKC